MIRKLLFALCIAALTGASACERVEEGPAVDTLHEEMVLVPGGEFVMGMEGGEDNPAHTVYVDPFYMDIHEVTIAEYKAFCDSTDRNLPEFWGVTKYRCGPGFADHPVLGVSQIDAIAYAEWAGKRLPTEAEWEFAARGGLAGKRFPHGDEMDETMENFKSEGTLPVGSLVPNGYGLYDMAGNVREWVTDYYDWDYYGESPRENPKGPDKEKFAVVRGGGWHAGKGCATVYVRYGLYPTWVDINVGFRCVKNPE
jgi:sulfatase modifying factor 1